MVYRLTDQLPLEINPMLSVFAVGVGKEVFDHFGNGTVEKEDIYATVLGGVVSSSIRGVF